MPADASILQSLAIGLVIAGVIILAWTFRSLFAQAFTRLIPRATANSARSTSAHPSPPRTISDFETGVPSSSTAAPEPRARPSPTTLSSVMDDAEELAQLISDRLDRQALRLEQLIAAADERLNRLEKAIAQPAPQAAAPQARREIADPLSRQIYDLADRGLPPVEIARQLSQHTGKVELILALRQR